MSVDAGIDGHCKAPDANGEAWANPFRRVWASKVQCRPDDTFLQKHVWQDTLGKT